MDADFCPILTGPTNGYCGVVVKHLSAVLVLVFVWSGVAALNRCGARGKKAIGCLPNRTLARNERDYESCNAEQTRVIEGRGEDSESVCR